MAGLDPEQEALLSTLVETARSIDDRSRRWFASVSTMTGLLLGSPVGHVQVSRADVQELTMRGLLLITGHSTRGDPHYAVSNEGFAYYEALKRATPEPLDAVEEEITRYMDATSFSGGFPAAYALWRKAADLLWAADSEAQLSTIGHAAREAMQEFVNALVERHNPPNVEANVERTINRLTAVVNVRAVAIGDADKELLDGLLAYWRGLNSVVQRLEHSGPTKQGKPATWEDARRVVTNCAVVMTELARELS